MNLKQVFSRAQLFKGSTYDDDEYKKSMNNLSELNQKQENIKNKKGKAKKSKMNFFKYLATQHNERCNKYTKHKQVVM